MKSSLVKIERLAALFERRALQLEHEKRRELLRVAQWTAQDIRSAARRSIKSGGKNKSAKSYQSSRPGEPPRSHVGTLKGAIRYEREGETFLIGPEALNTRGVLRALELGGFTLSEHTYYEEEYIERFLARRRHGFHPTTRPYTVASRTRSARLSRYYYFHSRDARERAIRAALFLQWTRLRRYNVSTRGLIRKRPFMLPAAIRELRRERLRERFRRARRRN